MKPLKRFVVGGMVWLPLCMVARIIVQDMSLDTVFLGGMITAMLGTGFVATVESYLRIAP